MFTLTYGFGKHAGLLGDSRKMIIDRMAKHHPIIAGFHGGFGDGKTAMAQAAVMARFCPSAERPCGVCPRCTSVLEALCSSPCVRAAVPGGGSFQVFDCTMLRQEHLQSIREDMTLYRSSPDMYVLDELHRANIVIQEGLLKLLEADLKSSIIFCFATPNINKVTEALLQRMLLFKIERPTSAEFIPFIVHVAKAEGIPILDVTAPEMLAIGCARIPRAVLRALEMLAIEGQGMTRRTVTDVCRRLSILNEGRESA